MDNFEGEQPKVENTDTETVSDLTSKIINSQPFTDAFTTFIQKRLSAFSPVDAQDHKPSLPFLYDLFMTTGACLPPIDELKKDLKDLSNVVAKGLDKVPEYVTYINLLQAGNSGSETVSGLGYLLDHEPGEEEDQRMVRRAYDAEKSEKSRSKAHNNLANELKRQTGYNYDGAKNELFGSVINYLGVDVRRDYYDDELESRLHGADKNFWRAVAILVSRPNDSVVSAFESEKARNQSPL